jgi:hypothetical protein
MTHRRREQAGFNPHYFSTKPERLKKVLQKNWDLVIVTFQALNESAGYVS